MGPAVDSDIVSAAFSGKSLVIKKNRVLIVDGETFEAPGGAVIVTFTSGGLVDEVFFPEANELWRRTGGKFERTPAAAIQAGAVIQDGELSLNGAPVRLQSRAQSISQMGDGWWVIYAEDRLFAVRDEQVYELPEDPA